MNQIEQNLQRSIEAANARVAGIYEGIDRAIGAEIVLSTNLYNQGMRDPNAAIAYRAVLRITGNPEAAWEAARQQELLFRRRLQHESHARHAAMRSDVYHFTVNHRRRLESDLQRIEQIEEIAKMPNPFAYKPAEVKA